MISWSASRARPPDAARTRRACAPRSRHEKHRRLRKRRAAVRSRRPVLPSAAQRRHQLASGETHGAAGCAAAAKRWPTSCVNVASSCTPASCVATGSCRSTLSSEPATESRPHWQPSPCTGVEMPNLRPKSAASWKNEGQRRSRSASEPSSSTRVRHMIEAMRDDWIDAEQADLDAVLERRGRIRARTYGTRLPIGIAVHTPTNETQKLTYSLTKRRIHPAWYRQADLEAYRGVPHRWPLIIAKMVSRDATATITPVARHMGRHRPYRAAIVLVLRRIARDIRANFAPAPGLFLRRCCKRRRDGVASARKSRSDACFKPLCSRWR